MIQNLKPYPVYKESGLPWIGKIPSHWKVEKVKHNFRYKKVKNARGLNKNVLSLTLNGVINNDIDNPIGLSPKDYATYQLFEKNDLVFKLIDLENIRTSRVGLVHENGIMSSAYLRLIENKGNDVKFFYHQFYDLYSRAVYNKLGAGVRSTLGPEDLKNLQILVPEIKEQKLISAFIDNINHRINRTIAAKKKLIALLNEQKQAIIHRAVTRGLDPNVKLKDSGIPWIGKVPEHWEVRKLKNLGKSIIGLTFSPGDLTDSGCRVFRASNVRNGKILFNEDDYFLNQSIPKKLMILKNDILICSRSGSKELIGKNAIVEDIIEKCTFGVFMTVYRSECNKYVYWVLNSQIFSSNLGLFFTSTINQLTRHDLDNMYITLPPKNEQDIICEYLKNEIEKINNIIRLEDDNCKLINEYKIKLISEIVTGKINLKDIAKNTSNVKGAKNE
ncbi:MAG TPA: restriction endonuclease subunit S [Candidatus Goldiibacteriota bacterium]|nr:restriction endonuclease subunit S [Candidatus Goldiibacteriota bacterium]